MDKKEEEVNIPELEEENIPEGEEEDGDGEDIEEKPEQEEEQLYARTVQVHTLNTQVEITSSCPDDNLEKIINKVTYLVDKYSRG